MLTLSKLQILNYARENRLRWIEDSTNREDIFDRNYIRRNIVPAIKNRFANAENAILDKLERDGHLRSKIEVQAKKELSALRTDRDSIELANLKCLEK